MSDAEMPPDAETELPLWSAADMPRPFWLTDELDSLPQELRGVIEGLIIPAYQEYVLMAKPGLEQSTGVTIVELMWLEALDMYQLSRRGGNAADVACADGREELIGRLLRLVGSKLKAQSFLLRLNEFRQRFGTLSV